MAQKKAFEVEGWLKRPTGAVGVVLFYGPDRGLVAERARAYAAASGLSPDDPFSVVRLDAGEVEQDPGKLLDEALTVPMFSEKRLLWVRNAAGQKGLAEAVKALCAARPRDAVVLIEAGDLKKGLPLRAQVEASDFAMALPCYPDEGRELDALMDQVFGPGGPSLTLEARQALRAQLGGDRLASRGELEKLALYAHGGDSVTLADVRALSGDVSAVSPDDAVDAVLEGDVGGFDAAFARLAGASGAVFQVLASALKQFQSLHAMRAVLDGGQPNATAIVAGQRPPVFFTRRKLMESALRRWPREAAERALDRLQAAILQTRRRPELAVAIARQALLGIAVEGARLRQRG